MKPSISTHSVSTNTGAIDAHVFEPIEKSSIRGTIVTVHPWSTLGGGEHNTIGLARHMATTSRPKSPGRTTTGCYGWRVITFTLKSNPLWKGGAMWGICSNHSLEVQQTVDVMNWAREKYDAGIIVLLGSSAGAPMAGTAMARLLKDQHKHQTEQGQGGKALSAYIAIGYTFGNFASLGFGRHFSSVVNSSSVPKLFIMGERDEFTSVEQLEQMTRKMRSTSDVETTVEIVANVGHFELESSSYDPMVAKMVLDWLDKV
mmetsp:Transcript_24713/g.59580  ORF Transcript_24713/g.59580 Transcript_24713/m.59580 type:complete len:259 (-) Transcript_24713:475-1251(-)|eukprot:CAMPEP_0181087642 /NCGR_PEP_ID=MMETSP1071-20121207/6379_1 /TAXON_ID=35127 /ORGANISM="Thalassiosira sp., Strain NH16" /LENGTH=258 /DNA_ID=CAMNT_0023169539 /DNA_START=292 /DNA_END=1068 /DNA_ORIENTATION=-